MAPTADTSRAGIRKLSTGESVIPSSTRADGTVRKEIRVKPGYKPPEDVEVYKNRTAHTFRNRGKGGVVGAEAVEEKSALSAAAGKNAKRREARKKAAVAADGKDIGGEDATAAETVKAANGKPQADAAVTPEEPPVVVDPEAEKVKEARKLAKKLRNAREPKDKLASVIKIQELIRQLDSLGFTADGQKKDAPDQDVQKKSADEKDVKISAG